MKIVNNRAICPTLEFGVFPVNHVFLYNQVLILKLDNNTQQFNCYNLSNGRKTFLNPRDLVEPVNATLTIERE